MKKLFALEVPEIGTGAVEIVALAREAGHRTKIAVRSNQPGVNAKGACIGPMGSRVRNVMAELHGVADRPPARRACCLGAISRAGIFRQSKWRVR